MRTGIQPLGLLRVMPCAIGLFFSGCAAGTWSDIDVGKDPLSVLVRLYEGPLNHMDAVRGGECPMYPSCSAYAKAALEKHGFLAGWIMASDRLMRCGRDEVKLSPRILINGKWRSYDPLENNDYWWSVR